MVFSKKNVLKWQIPPQCLLLKGSRQPWLGLTNICGGDLSEGRKGLSHRARVLLPPRSDHTLPRGSTSLAFSKLFPSACCCASSSHFPRAGVFPTPRSPGAVSKYRILCRSMEQSLAISVMPGQPVGEGGTKNSPWGTIREEQVVFKQPLLCNFQMTTSGSTFRNCLRTVLSKQDNNNVRQPQEHI